MSNERQILGASVAGLRALVEPLSPEELRAPAYPSEWTIADVLSHLGSGAEIFTLWVEQALGGPEAVPQPIWDEWNAKDPDAKAADALRADGALLKRLDALSDGERERLTFRLGPLTVDHSGLIRLRINEHTVHTWDIAVVADPAATLPSDAAAIVLEALPIIAGYTAKPTGSTRRLHLRTSAPDRSFVVDLSTEAVAFAPFDEPAAPDLALPAEALVRLVYGRLDPAHTPAFHGSEADLDELRRVFPGV